MTTQYFGHIFFEIPKITFGLKGCVDQIDMSKAMIIRLDEPKHVPCDEGTRVFQVGFDKFSKVVDPSFLDTLPSDIMFLSVAFFSDEQN